MNADLTDVMAQKRELDNKADELAEIHRGLVCYRNQLDGVWVASEIIMIDEAIEKLNRRISRVREELCDIGIDMLKAGGDIAEEAAVREKEEQRATEERKAADKAVSKQPVLQTQRIVKSNSAMKKIFAFLK